MSVYFIGCLHFGHENMAKMRGFDSSEEHDKVLLDGINSVVTKRDKLFILGDVTMETARHYRLLDQIKGIKQVVMGTHSHRNKIWCRCGCMKYKGWMLSHIPIHPIEFDSRVSRNIHAHLHDKFVDDDRYFNVDAEMIDYTPISYDEISAKLQQ